MNSSQLGTWPKLIRNLAIEIGQKEFYEKRLQRETIRVNLGNFVDSRLTAEKCELLPGI